MPKINSDVWKALFLVAVSVIVTIAGTAYFVGSNDTRSEIRANQLEEHILDIQATLTSIETQLKAQHDMNTSINYRLDAYDSKSANRWTSQDMKIFSLEMRIENPDVNVPDVDKIIQGRSTN